MSAKEVMQLQLLCTLFVVAIQAPTILAYVVQVLIFAKEEHTSAFMTYHPVEKILWTSTG